MIIIYIRERDSFLFDSKERVLFLFGLEASVAPL